MHRTIPKKSWIRQRKSLPRWQPRVRKPFRSIPTFRLKRQPNLHLPSFPTTKNSISESFRPRVNRTEIFPTFCSTRLGLDLNTLKIRPTDSLFRLKLTMKFHRHPFLSTKIHRPHSSSIKILQLRYFLLEILLLWNRRMWKDRQKARPSIRFTKFSSN